MKAARLPGSLTVFSVVADTMGCSRTLYCDFVTKPNTFLSEGNQCPKCEEGQLERRIHTVDIASFDAFGQCSCERFQFAHKPVLERMTPQQRLEMPHNDRQMLICKHGVAARAEAKKGSNFDDLLRAIPQENRNGP